MWKFDDQSGVASSVVCLVILVLVGTGLSIAVDTRFKTASQSAKLKRESSVAQETLRELRAMRELRSADLAAAMQKAPSAVISAAADQQLAAVVNNAEKLALLESQRSDLEAGLGLVEQEFGDYRKAYRDARCAEAVGEKIAELQPRNGRTYQDITITRVTPVGIEFHHKFGIARVEAPDLGPDWHERFQWDDEERREQLEKERLQREQFVNAIRKPKRKAPPLDTAALRRLRLDQQAEITDALRENVVKWQDLIGKLESELETAQIASRGKKSVPGSLETWASRSKNLNNRIAAAYRELDAAKSRLSEWAPKDRLLLRH